MAFVFFVFTVVSNLILSYSACFTNIFKGHHSSLTQSLGHKLILLTAKSRLHHLDAANRQEAGGESVSYQVISTLFVNVKTSAAPSTATAGELDPAVLCWVWIRFHQLTCQSDLKQLSKTTFFGFFFFFSSVENRPHFWH